MKTRIRELRKARKLSQEELAEAAGGRRRIEKSTIGRQEYI